MLRTTMAQQVSPRLLISALSEIYLTHTSHSKMFEHVDELTPALLKTLSDESDKVVKVDLEVLAEMSSLKSSEPAERKDQTDNFFRRYKWHFLTYSNNLLFTIPQSLTGLCWISWPCLVLIENY